MKRTQEVDLINEKPMKAILMFAIPLIFANLFFQLYATIDTIIVGKFNGDNAMAAVGASFAVTMVMISFATGTGTGCSVLISRYFGEKKQEQIKTSVSTVLIFSAVFSVLIMLFGILFSRPLLELLGTPSNIMDDAVSYLQIYSMGMPFMFLYNVQSAVFSSFGNSKMSLQLLILSSGINVVLDLLMVGCWSMGVKGAAIATVIAQGIVFVVSFVLLVKEVYYSDETKNVGFQFFSILILREMLSYMAVAILQSSITSIGLLLIQSVVNQFGSDTLAGYVAGNKIDSFCIVPFMACGNALTTFTAQNLGAGKKERIRQGYRACIGLCVIMSIMIAAIILIFHNLLIGLYLDFETSSSAAIETALTYITQMSVFYILMGITSSQTGMIRGEGMLKILYVNCFLSLFIRVGFAFSMVHVIGVNAVWLSLPAGWIVSILYCKIARRQNIRKAA